jgi:antitoxin CptB
MQESLENKRKRLIYRSWHRGTREMDLILGSFADRHVPGFDDAALARYEEILQHNDPDLYNWITGTERLPANYMNPVMEMLLRHKIDGPR